LDNAASKLLPFVNWDTGCVRDLRARPHRYAPETRFLLEASPDVARNQADTASAYWHFGKIAVEYIDLGCCQALLSMTRRL
jgi:hypothetical protein